MSQMYCMKHDLRIEPFDCPSCVAELRTDLAAERSLREKAEATPQYQEISRLRFNEEQMRHRAEAAEKRLAEIERERDEARAEWAEWKEQHERLLAMYQATESILATKRDEARAEVVRLRKAIAPVWPTDQPIEQLEELMRRYREGATKVYTARLESERDAQAEEIRRLREALLGVAPRKEGNRPTGGACWCIDVDDVMYPHDECCIAARTALAEGKEEG